MPTRPDPNSPFMDSRLQSAFGVRAPGSPTSAGKPGVQAGDVSFPAPPGLNGAAPGRPSAPASPTPPVAMPAAPAPQAAPPKEQGAATMLSDAPGGGQQPQQPGQPATPVAPGPSVMPRTGTFGEAELAITPEGAQRYREASVRSREALGPLPRVFRTAGLPEMPVEPGKWNYSPFTGRWSQ